MTNANSHVRKRWVYTIDIKDFFPTITWGRVFGMLQKHPVGMPEPVARFIANLATREQALPQGAPTSPVLANLVCRGLDARLHRLGRERGFVYTRYADDLTFSTNKAEFTPEDQEAIALLVNAEGFSLNPSKRRLMPHSGRQMVTGLVVNRLVNVPKHFVKSLRALLNNVDRYGWESQTDRDFAFDSWADWEAYRTGALTDAEEGTLRTRQRKKHLLLNPRARIPSVASRSGSGALSASRAQQSSLLRDKVREQRRQVRSLQRVVAGRLEFLRMVRGPDYSAYRHLYDQYRYLRSRSETERTSYDEHRRRVKAFDPGYDDRVPLYREFGGGRIGSLTEGELEALLRDRATEILEFGWLASGSPDFREKAQELAFQAYLCSPRLTGAFAKSFRERDGFEGLLHVPSESTPATSRLVAQAMGQVRAYKGKVPNRIYWVCENFLAECQKRAGATGWHPMTAPGFEEEFVVPFKKSVRLGRDASVFQLHVHLNEAANSANDSRVASGRDRVEVMIKKASMVFTHTASVTDAMKRIVTTLIEKTNADIPSVSVRSKRVASQTDSLDRTVFTISAPGTVISGTPQLAEQFGGDMKAALQELRGFADWTMSAKFDDGLSYQFDVMRNACTELVAPVDGATHTITFYRST